MPPRYVVVKDGRVRAVSSSAVAAGQDAQVLEVPPELEGLPAAALIGNCAVRDGRLTLGALRRPAKDLRVAFVGNWRMRCGISTYSEKLWPEVAKHVGARRLFVERDNDPSGPLNELGGELIDPADVVPCWTRGQPLGELVAAVRAWGPDVVWIQHEYGLWPNARHWLALLSQLSDVRVVVTFHSVYRHMDKLVAEAPVPEAIVHQEAAREVLKGFKRVPGLVHVVPHGCDPCLDKTRLWNIYRSERTFAQFGFGFRYKGWENSICAVAILKGKYPDVFFTGVFAESPFCLAEHAAYAADLARLTRELGVQDHVALVRGFQPDTVIDSYMRTNRVVVFPYVSHPKHEVFGSSGSARVAMSKGVPVITSSVNHFADLPSIKADTPQQIADALEALFEGKAAWAAQVEAQGGYLEENSWANVGRRVASAFGDLT